MKRGDAKISLKDWNWGGSPDFSALLLKEVETYLNEVVFSEDGLDLYAHFPVTLVKIRFDRKSIVIPLPLRSLRLVWA